MIGRAAYDNPYLFAMADREIYGQETIPPSRREVAARMLPYIDEWTSKGLQLNKISRHILQLFAGQPGSRAWKRYISENAHLPGSCSEVIRAALEQVPI